MYRKHPEGRGHTHYNIPAPGILPGMEQALCKYLSKEWTTRMRLTVTPWLFWLITNSKKGKANPSRKSSKEFAHVCCTDCFRVFFLFCSCFHFYCCVSNHPRTQWLETTLIYYFSGSCGRSLLGLEHAWWSLIFPDFSLHGLSSGSSLA